MHPILFHIGSFPIPAFGMLVALGFLAALLYTRWAARRVNFPEEEIDNLAVVLMIAGFIGARLAYILVEWRLFLQNPSSLIFSREGFVFYGGFLAGVAACVIFVRRRGLSLPLLVDAIAPAVALAHAIGRIGCFLNGCCYGGRCDFDGPLFRFPRVTNPSGEVIGSPAYLDHLYGQLVTHSDRYSLPIHPTQLYEAVSLLVLFFVLHLLYRKTRGVDAEGQLLMHWKPGALFLLYLGSYAIIRFALETFRADDRGWIIPDVLSTSQGVGVAILVALPFLYSKLSAWKAADASQNSK